MKIQSFRTTTFASSPITHYRLKAISEMAQCTEDHISRIALGLSIKIGKVDSDWVPSTEGHMDADAGNFNEKQLRGSTFFKGDLELWIALVLTRQTPSSYSELRDLLVSHWERGVEELYRIFERENDWLRVLNSCMK